MVLALGFFAQALFGARILVQWIRSEKVKQVVSPSLFWKISLIASLLFTLYGLLRNDIVIVFGQVINYFIYIRNLQLKKDWYSFPLILRILTTGAPLIIISLFIVNGNFATLAMVNIHSPWTITGLIGQMILNFRFIYQWYQSEKYHESLFTRGFWIISMVGSVLVTAYGIVKADPVLIVAQSLGFMVYARNIKLSITKPVQIN